MKQKLGKSSIRLEEPVYILGSGSVVGTKEGQGPLGLLFDQVGEDDMFGCSTWEDAESSLQKSAVSLALEKTGLESEDISYLFAGDLLGQSIATSFGLSTFQIPLFGVYGACSTCGESLALGAMSIAGGYADRVVCVTSSHFASAEKEFRFPLEFVLGNREAMESMKKTEWEGKRRRPRARISGMTVGKIVDYGLKDSMNMGACMAPAAASTLKQHFSDFGCQPDDYDKIITGDLGKVGQKVLLDFMRDRGFDISCQHMDCGIEIYDGESQDTHAGGSGCGCSAVTLSAYILKQLEEGNWKKVLFLPTGALLSKTSFNEGKSVPGIAHGVVIEAI